MMHAARGSTGCLAVQGIANRYRQDAARRWRKIEECRTGTHSIHLKQKLNFDTGCTAEHLLHEEKEEATIKLFLPIYPRSLTRRHISKFGELHDMIGQEKSKIFKIKKKKKKN